MSEVKRKIKVDTEVAKVKKPVGRPPGSGKKTEQDWDRISFSYSNDMKDRLLMYAEREKRSLAAYIKLVLQKHLEMRERKDKESK